MLKFVEVFSNEVLKYTHMCTYAEKAFYINYLNAHDSHVFTANRILREISDPLGGLPKTQHIAMSACKDQVGNINTSSPAELVTFALNLFCQIGR